MPIQRNSSAWDLLGSALCPVISSGSPTVFGGMVFDFNETEFWQDKLYNFQHAPAKYFGCRCKCEPAWSRERVKRVAALSQEALRYQSMDTWRLRFVTSSTSESSIHLLLLNCWL